MATYSEASAQYENRFDCKCEDCGAELWRSIEWAKRINDRHKLTIHSDMWDSPNAGFIVMKRCKACREERNKKFANL